MTCMVLKSFIYFSYFVFSYHFQGVTAWEHAKICQGKLFRILKMCKLNNASGLSAFCLTMAVSYYSVVAFFIVLVSLFQLCCLRNKVPGIVCLPALSLPVFGVTLHCSFCNTIPKCVIIFHKTKQKIIPTYCKAVCSSPLFMTSDTFNQAQLAS